MSEARVITNPAPGKTPAEMVPAVVLEPGLVRAADHLRECGWQQHALGFSNGPKCAEGAIWTRDVDREEATRLMRIVERSLGLRYGNLTGWNDAPGRTADEVIDALERAAYGL